MIRLLSNVVGLSVDSLMDVSVQAGIFLAEAVAEMAHDVAFALREFDRAYEEALEKRFAPDS